MSEMSGVEVLIPLILEAPAPNIPTFSVRHESLEGWLTQSGSYNLLACAKDLGCVYSIAPRFRPETPSSPNHLIQFHLIQAISLGDYRKGISTALELIHNVTSKISANMKSNADGLILASFPEPEDYILQQDDGVELDYSGQMNLISENGGAPVVLTDKKVELAERSSPCAHITYKCEEGRYHAFDILFPFGGEVASGGEIEVDTGKLREQIENSRDAQAMLQKGYDNIMDQYVPYIKAVEQLEGPHFLISISVERLLQFILSESEIANAAPFSIPATSTSFFQQDRIAH